MGEGRKQKDACSMVCQYYVEAVYVPFVMGTEEEQLAMFWGPREGGIKMR